MRSIPWEGLYFFVPFWDNGGVHNAQKIPLFVHIYQSKRTNHKISCKIFTKMIDNAPNRGYNVDSSREREQNFPETGRRR